MGELFTAQNVQNIGFPILCCIVLFVQNGQLTKTIGELKEVLIKNTTLLETLTKQIELKGE